MSEFNYGNGYEDGRFDERNRLMEVLEDAGVVRRDAFNELVYVNCNSMVVEYLDEKVIKGAK